MAPPPNSNNAAARGARDGAPRRVVVDKREAILDAALELFVERGFYGTAVPELAERAGVGAGTIYRYFESKEAIVNILYRQEKLRFAHLALADFPHQAPTREQFRLLWQRMADYAGHSQAAFVFLELHHHASYLDAESRAVEDRMNDLFGRVVTAAQARRELKPGPTHLIMAIVMGAFIGVIRSCVQHATPLAPDDWTFAEQCAWEAIRA